MIYLDNAATSFPKPEGVYGEIDRILREVGGNPGRGGHKMAIDAGRVVFEAREAAAELFGLQDSSGVVFTKNGTEALNLAIKGCLSSGDHVVTTDTEHNSVTRPLKRMETNEGVEVSKVRAGADGSIA
ncbi:MAG: aminotransferase class V-fold PLP-dependent enzyme, partial [Thermodesulfobacteriota bacterium]